MMLVLAIYLYWSVVHFFIPSSPEQSCSICKRMDWKWNIKKKHRKKNQAVYCSSVFSRSTGFHISVCLFPVRSMKWYFSWIQLAILSVIEMKLCGYVIKFFDWFDSFFHRFTKRYRIHSFYLLKDIKRISIFTVLHFLFHFFIPIFLLVLLLLLLLVLHHHRFDKNSKIHHHHHLCSDSRISPQYSSRNGFLFVLLWPIADELFIADITLPYHFCCCSNNLTICNE